MFKGVISSLILGWKFNVIIIILFIKSRNKKNIINTSHKCVGSEYTYLHSTNDAQDYVTVRYILLVTTTEGFFILSIKV